MILAHVPSPAIELSSAKLPARPATHFSWEEVQCKHCRKLPHVSVTQSLAFRALCVLLDTWREETGQPVRITSWYRCPMHPIELAKPGTHLHPHNTGLAVDVAVPRTLMPDLLSLASRYMETLRFDIGLGLNLNEPTTYLHIDIARENPSFDVCRPALWTY